MNLSCYSSLDPRLNDCDDEKGNEAGSKALPADNQSAALVLDPGECRVRGGDGGVFGIIALIRCQAPEPFVRSALLTRADVHGIQQREDLGPLVPIRGCGARR
jgi:hypothetical protein